MRAVRFDSYGDVDVLDVVDVDKPEPGPGQVLVAVRAAGINPGETKIRSGALHERWPAHFPEGEGSDFAGVVDALGPGVTAFAVGDEVLGYTNDRASHAEFVVAAIDEIVPKPPALDWPRAGALFIVGTSAYALIHAAEVSARDVVMVSAAAGGVGSLAAQWAHNLGATVIGVAGRANHEWLRGVGVEPVDYADSSTADSSTADSSTADSSTADSSTADSNPADSNPATPDLAERVRRAAGGRPVTAVLDTHGPEYVQLGLDLGVDPPRIATIADFAAGERGATVVQHFRVATPQVLTEIAGELAGGRLQMPIAATYPLARVRDAYRQLEHGHTRGKIVLIP